MSERNDLKDHVFMGIANRLGELSTCDRATIGALIVCQGRCISWGFNGAPPGLPHCAETDHGHAVKRGDRIVISLERRGEGCRWATHAEANAVAFAARQGISTAGGQLFVTQSPCEACARLLIAAGIIRVCYNKPYRDSTGLELLEMAGMVIAHINSEEQA